MLVLGCGCLTVAGAVLAGFLALNWSAVNSLYQRASGSMAELTGIQHFLQTQYQTPQVAVVWRKYSGASGTILVVRMINPPFLKDIPLDDAEPRAREIALEARNHLRDPMSAPAIEVALTKQAGFGVTIATSRAFRFTASELGDTDGQGR